MKKKKAKQKIKPTRSGQITMPPQYWAAIDKKIVTSGGKLRSRSEVIRLALDLMEWG